MEKTENIIDRKDEVVAALRRDIHLAEWLEQDFRNGVPVDELRDASYLIEAQAARIAELEAAEALRHETWKPDGFGGYSCTGCGQYERWIPNYCLNCGAKMDSEE